MLACLNIYQDQLHCLRPETLAEITEAEKCDSMPYKRIKSAVYQYAPTMVGECHLHAFSACPRHDADQLQIATLSIALAFAFITRTA